MMMYTPSMSRELWVFKIIMTYVFFIEFIYNTKIEEGDGADDNVYILHV
jgi:hypothetical protein